MLEIKNLTVSVKDKIILKDLNTNEEQIIAETSAWNVQQSCRLQWIGPDFNSRILYNDFIEGKLKTVILDINDNTKLFFIEADKVETEKELLLSFLDYIGEKDKILIKAINSLHNFTIEELIEFVNRSLRWYEIKEIYQTQLVYRKEKKK